MSVVIENGTVGVVCETCGAEESFGAADEIHITPWLFRDGTAYCSGECHWRRHRRWGMPEAERCGK